MFLSEKWDHFSDRNMLQNAGARTPHHNVIPARAGTHWADAAAVDGWVPACAGMTEGWGKFAAKIAAIPSYPPPPYANQPGGIHLIIR
jgi:hypothetical protein